MSDQTSTNRFRVTSLSSDSTSITKQPAPCFRPAHPTRLTALAFTSHPLLSRSVAISSPFPRPPLSGPPPLLSLHPSTVFPPHPLFPLHPLHQIRPSVRPSVRKGRIRVTFKVRVRVGPFICPSVRPSVRPFVRVRPSVLPSASVRPSRPSLPPLADATLAYPLR